MPGVRVRPHVRRTHGTVGGVSGYRRYRASTLKMLAGGEAPRCAMCGSLSDVQIAHRVEDEFSSFEARSGGTRYSRWLKFIRDHPKNYILLCARCHSLQTGHGVTPPFMHDAALSLEERRRLFHEWQARFEESMAFEPQRMFPGPAERSMGTAGLAAMTRSPADEPTWRRLMREPSRITTKRMVRRAA